MREAAVDDRSFSHSLLVFLRSPPAERYGERGNDYGRYDAPPGCVHG